MCSGTRKPESSNGVLIQPVMSVKAIQSAARFDIDDPEVMIKFWLLANQLGLDTDYITAGLSWLFECYEKGFITKKDTGGLERLGLKEITDKLARQGKLVDR